MYYLLIGKSEKELSQRIGNGSNRCCHGKEQESKVVCQNML